MARPDASVPSLLLLSLALELLPESTSVAGEAEAEVLGDACELLPESTSVAGGAEAEVLGDACELLPESTSVAGEAEAEVLGDACGLGVRVAAADAATAAPLPPLVLPPPWLVKL